MICIFDFISEFDENIHLKVNEKNKNKIKFMPDDDMLVKLTLNFIREK